MSGTNTRKNLIPVAAMRARTHRGERLADQIRQELTELIEYEIKDPRVGLASVTAVELSENLRRVRVMVRVRGDDPQRETSLVGLEAARSFLRRELAQRLALRFSPAISFHLDLTQINE